jgi:hypothetical protein
MQPKYLTTIIIGAGISHDLKSDLVSVESGTIDAVAYLDDFVDASGIISEMNSRYEMKNSMHM